MYPRNLALALGMAGALAVTAPAGAETLQWAFQGQLNALDPYTLNESFTNGQLGNVYEGLVSRDENLKIIPALATSWEMLDPTHWRFHLREGVKFHNGNDFTADDVLFSAERVRSKSSNFKTRLPATIKVEKVDKYTVDFILEHPRPTLYYTWSSWYIMDEDWAKENGAVEVVAASDLGANKAAFTTNGTGPYIITSHEPGVKTVFEANPDYWGEVEGNIDKVIFRPIAQAATRVAALLSGEIDLMDPVPVQDIPRVESSPTTHVLTGPELRTIFLGFNQMDDELSSSNVKGKNPFKDVRVRKAFYQAINEDAIVKKIMRGRAVASALMISPLLYDRADEFDRYPYDPEAAKKLLAEAGYPDGFSLMMDCPNDRYVNDAEICQAVVAMLSKVGVEINLNAQPKAQYFSKVLASGGYDTDFYLLGWTPSSFDSHNVLVNLVICRDEAGNGGGTNLGGYCNPKVDELTKKISSETDPEKRNELIYQAFKIMHDEVAYIPLHQQALAWGASDKLEVAQRADNEVFFRWMTKGGM